MGAAGKAGGQPHFKHNEGAWRGGIPFLEKRSARHEGGPNCYTKFLLLRGGRRCRRRRSRWCGSSRCSRCRFRRGGRRCCGCSRSRCGRSSRRLDVDIGVATRPTAAVHVEIAGDCDHDDYDDCGNPAAASAATATIDHYCFAFTIRHIFPLRCSIGPPGPRLKRTSGGIVPEC